VKIWQKILLGFLFVFVLISLSGVPPTFYYAKTFEHLEKFMTHDLQSLNTLEEMERTILEMNATAYRYQASRSEKDLKQLQETKRKWLRLKDQLREFLEADEASIPTFHEVSSSTQNWMENVEASLDPKNKTLPPLEPIRTEYRKLHNLQLSRLARTYQESVKIVEQGGNLAWSLKVVALIVGLVTCVAVIRSVKNPLDRLMQATEAVSAGQFEPVSPVSRDEFGQLTRAFNNMSQSLKERTANLEEQRRLAVQSSELKSEFLANTSHELRTPLNTIIGYSQLIQDGLARNREEELKYLTTIQESSKHLLSLINDILDIARIESGQMKLELQPCLVKEVLSQVEEHMQLPAKKKGLELQVSLEDRDLKVHAHPGRLKQVLLNVVGNSIKFTEHGRVQVAVSPDKNLNSVRFTISDTGIGIPVEKQSRLFQKFVQIDGSAHRHFGGTGLGLALSKTLLELMNGSIGISSEGEGKGATVVFTLKRDSGTS
jgi:signal transduction histidine kinase